MDIENRPIEGAIITDDSSSSVSFSYHNGTYKLYVGEGWIYFYLYINLIKVNYIKFYYKGIRTIRVDAHGYYTSIKSINIQDDNPQTVIFKLIKDERVFNMPRLMFIVLTGNWNKKI